ncbi:MAG: N-acetylmuramoyl-L-alanine amidase [Proteobacteria bacterium]|nr:N-acetylmuramoyl-L-alanine amidase [Pseudomonadota bacterium]
MTRPRWIDRIGSQFLAVRSARPACRTTAIVGCAGLLALSLSVSGASRVENVRIHQSPDKTRVVLDLESPVEHRLFSLENPERLVLDIDAAMLSTRLEEVDLKGSPVRSIRSSARGENDLRVVFDLTEKVRPRSFVLKPVMQYGDRLVIDLYTTGQNLMPITREELFKKQMRDVVIAIDAGHGGDDPGAVGHGDVLEKDVVLAIATMMNEMFQAQPGYRGLMVRSGDYYLELRRRTSIAHENLADIFLSVHADAFQSPRVSGASVYVLSDSGATSETARILAEKENRADLIGGVGGGVSLNDKDDLLVHVLLDLASTASLSASLEMGERVLGKMGRVNKLHKPQVEQAGFVVLKSLEIPSLLIETGYISNPSEARKLATGSHQRKLAQAIYEGIRHYLEDHPPPGSFLAWKQGQGGDELLTYVIERGDTLSEIANRYEVSFEDLKKVNGLRNDRIRVGQVLKIPIAEAGG